MPPSRSQKAIGCSPAKLILFGEHSVAFAEPALGIALSRGARAELRHGRGEVQTILPMQCPIPDAAAAVTPKLLFEAALGERAAELDAKISIEVPPLCGFGTSAAVTIALLRAFATLEDRDEERGELFRRAIEVEHLAHGSSSGLDPAICLYGGVVAFRKRGDEREIKPLRLGSSFHLVISSRGTHGGTKLRVQHMAELQIKAPKITHAAMRTLGSASKTGIRAFSRGDLELAGRAVDLAHGVLSGLGFVSDPVEERVRKARHAGALGAKMSGAGGSGGAMFALAPDIVTAQKIADVIGDGELTWIETVA